MPKVRKEYENQNGTLTLKGSMPVFDSNNDINLLNNINIPGAIVKEYSGSTYAQQLQSKSGTIALLGDIPTVSGTNDGTNWTAITINNSTYSIPAGGIGSINWGDIAGISDTTYTFTSAFRDKIISGDYRIEIPLGFIANDVAWLAYPTGKVIRDNSGQSTTFYTYLATFGAYAYKFIFQDENGTLTLNTTTGVGPASDEYSFSAEENHLGIWSEDKGTVGDLYGRPLNGNALIGGNSLYPSDDANQFLINRSDAITGATTVSADFVESSATLYYKQLSGANYSYLPLATQSWVGSQGYITSSALNGYATEVYVGSAISALTYVSVGAASAAHTHTYSDVGALSVATHIPSDPVNADWSATTGLSSIKNKPILGTAASMASTAFRSASWMPTYTDVGALSAGTHIPSDPVNADWSATTGLSSILNKPTLGTAASMNSTAFRPASWMPTYSDVGALSSATVIPSTYSDVGAASATHEHFTYVERAGDTMTGQLIAQNNIAYTTAQVRNIILSTSEPTSSDGANGDIWIVYKE